MGRHIAIAGVTGAVGQEFLKIIEERKFPFDSIKMLASSRSAGKKIEFMKKTYIVEELTANSFKGIDIALFSAGGARSKEFAPAAVKAGAVVIDNSSAFRMDPQVPLVVPEINPEAIRQHKGIIANPNCSTIIANVPVWPLHKANPVKRMVVSTYQAASGAGQSAMLEMLQQAREVLDGKPVTCKALKYQLAFNLYCHDSKIGPNGYNEEEMKMVKETQKIFNCPSIAITCTCVRVPVLRTHCESINLEFTHPITPDQVRDLLSTAPGVSIIDDRANNRFPMPLDATGKDDVYVGHIRQDESIPDNRGINLWVAGDQIRKGAALNAIQIAEKLL
ncbi:MAG TPA: aspartate-semialdehyde dehydrogenase [Anaerohalosphaeraceae bacterium]|nr:aspartate-semialdehyde dehydrogenase [Phycisphaerae bacterium]HOK95525.1 aspartate-semialdehyde dehydrogenase [Anaerohalosphaeraceae bacterium]HOL32510.1 aspartate-semialdehyde dehydrogenase [Anaerohalosphaeraceae bacterium]HOM77533.1 aspartate-semialdehyde dehydrogenase [Anaerohalosphaeraceae bacterium]HPC65204.1 aspartate-semialdehyde dehydrogenase [Anaerohalosphaeraceae bacterium]